MSAPRWFLEHRTKERRKPQSRFTEFLVKEGVGLVIHPASRGEDGKVFPPRSGNRHVEDALPAPSIAFTPEYCNRSYVHETANRDDLIPRKSLPDTQPLTKMVAEARKGK